MELHPPMAGTAGEMKIISGAVRSDQLECVTPCGEYDVRALLNHLMLFAPVLARAGSKQPALSDPNWITASPSTHADA